ncbi:efflux RND transporter periplasmic adaptor subunit [Algoriphagus hitonicola]|uniref:RND family efflux transporter, MFP subunit n=1 Tax=Algoriphagus hitonicola TaxID=435880 RepID=A0A1I2P2W5_9BACT|nr:efflux RND transporter periplasmic adaptor subunit [Algoriphagus hitonicola]SFG10522.1 RND family efflux transporter, MFP subunit [Algoriphagus hitonicola]
MKGTLKFLPISLAMILAFSCAENDSVEAKKAELEKLKAEVIELNGTIRELESELTQLDSGFAQQNQKSILITTADARKGNFEHFVEVTGAVLSKKNVSISAETAGRIVEVPAIEGMRVSRGQVLAEIDSESIQRNIEEIENSLDLARTLFEKQERLWKQQIGTEVQYLEAKSRKEGLERNLNSLKTQLDKAFVRAPFDGTIETVQVRLGELVQPGAPMFQFVGENDLFIEADISESYVGVLGKGDSVRVSFPSIGQEIKTRVSSVGSIINPNNRTFKVEVFMPKLDLVKPNMLAVMKIKDYENPEAVVVPSKLVLSDNRGDYVFVVEEGKAQKIYVKRGKTFQQDAEILEGLAGNEQLVDKGFREVGDNFNVNIAQQ